MSIEKGTVASDVLHHTVQWRIPTLKIEAVVGHAASQYAKLSQVRWRCIHAEDKKPKRRAGIGKRERRTLKEKIKALQDDAWRLSNLAKERKHQRRLQCRSTTSKQGVLSLPRNNRNDFRLDTEDGPWFCHKYKRYAVKLLWASWCRADALPKPPQCP